MNFWKSILVRPQFFYRSVFKQNYQTYFPLVIIVYALLIGIDRVEMQLMKSDFGTQQGLSGFIDNWTNYWLMVGLLALIAGFIAYYIKGWFYHLRIKWSNGDTEIEESRALLVYSEFFLGVFTIFYTLLETVLYPYPNSMESSYEYLEFFLFLFTVLFIIHSLFLSYTGVIKTANAKPSIAAIWFLVIPATFYVLVFGGVFMLYMANDLY